MTSLSFARSHARATVLVFAALLLAAFGATALYAARAGNGSDWHAVGLPGVTVHFLALSREARGPIFAATEGGVYRRMGAGAWTRVLGVSSVWAVTLLPDDRTVIAGDAGGDVDISRDRGEHWRQVRVTRDGVYAVTTQPGTSTTVIAGGGGGLYRSIDGGTHWRRTLTVRNSAGAAFAWSATRGPTLYAGMVAGGIGGNTQVYVSHDAGFHWHLFGRALDSHGGIMALAASSGRVYAGTMGNTIWTLPAAGGSWRKTAAGIPPTQHVSGIATIPRGSTATLFAATLAAGVFHSDDAGRHWTGISGGLPGSSGDRIVLTVDYSAGRNALFAGTVDGVYELKNS